MFLTRWIRCGHIRARRIHKHTNHDGTKYVEILVKARNQNGVVRDHVYDVYYRLLSKFVNDCAGFWDIRKLHVEFLDPKTAIYEITYEPTKKSTQEKTNPDSIR